MQNLLIGVVLVAVFIYLGGKLFRLFHSRSSPSCGCDCSGCGETECRPVLSDKIEQDSRK